jgi:hypothetical protein
VTTAADPREAHADPHDIRHGYNLADLDRLARIAASRSRGQLDVWAERVELAWSGIAEALCAASEPPDPVDLLRAGTRAVNRQSLEALRVTRARFHTYWSAHHGASPERRIVEHLALWQIWHSMPRRHQQALLLLATLEDDARAAEVLGCTRNAFDCLLYAARRRFREAWHEGETPSHHWRQDHRAARGSATDSVGRQRITVSQLETIRARRSAGETLKAIAADFGVSRPTIGNLLRGRFMPAADPLVCSTPGSRW